MASVSTSKIGLRKIQFSDGNGKRPIVRLGRISKKKADRIAAKIESILECKLSCRALDNETAEWLGEIPDVLHKRLAAVGLIAPREKQQPDTTTLSEFIDAYLAERVDLKPSTLEQLRQVQNNLLAFTGKSMTLAAFNAGHADAFKASLASRLADNSVRRNLGRCRQFFAAAVRKTLIKSNPFGHLKGITVKGNDERFCFVETADIQRVIDAAPDAQWRVIIALARYGGLRTPSETLALKWDDIDWARQRIRITSPKTAHVGKASRVIPLFPELLPYLLDASELAEKDSEYVVTRYRDASQNLRTTMLKIIKRAGLEPWERVFQNLRATRQTELSRKFPAHVVCDWMGNSEDVAQEHYLHATDEDFQQACHNRQATHNPTHSGSEINEMEGTGVIRPLRENEKAPAFPGHSAAFHSLHKQPITRPGLEPGIAGPKPAVLPITPSGRD